MYDLPKDIGPRLRAARGYIGVSISEMAKLLGRNRATVRIWEDGKLDRDPLKIRGIVTLYVDLSGLPEWFFLTPDLHDPQTGPPLSNAEEAAKKAKQAREAVLKLKQDKPQADS